MKWVLYGMVLWSVALLAPGRRLCAGNLAKERIKAAEKVSRDKRFNVYCCSPVCPPPLRRHPPTSRRYQPYHKTWYGLKYGCNCSSVGSESRACDIRTGQCRCKPHVTGRACDVCEEGYWGLSEGGCRPCACGAGGTCDPETGACACGEGLTGPHCDACLPGYYGYGPAGCLPCQPCKEGRVCSASTGRCTCPAHTRGARCERCAPGYWGRAPHCRPCKCGPTANSTTCDSESGQCPCRAGWSGRACDSCSPGHYGPACRPCACYQPGTRCDDGICACDEKGQCPCKENVSGIKCDECRAGTFDLSAENPAGCTACFCFGRSVQCAGGRLTRDTLRAAGNRTITVLYGDLMEELELESLISIPADVFSATLTPPQPPAPIYWTLPAQFSGDLVTSYGGYLRYRAVEKGGTEIPSDVMDRFPLVRIYAGEIELDYFEHIHPNHTAGDNHGVRLHESLFRSGNARVSRPALMATLARVTRVLVRATTRAPLYDDPVVAVVYNITLDTALAGPHVGHAGHAAGHATRDVELCSCPRGYAASSCHRPQPGYYMPHTDVHFRTVAGTIVIRTEDDVQPCWCNGRSESCDPVTGHCLNCTANTSGPFCDSCAPGYIKSAKTGECAACRCDVAGGRVQPLCDTSGDTPRCVCAEGYTGIECRTCAPGYYQTSLGSCSACSCSTLGGAVGRECDEAGRCRCRANIAGDKCDYCEDQRSVMTDDGCLACDNCTGTLLDAIEALSTAVREADINELTKLPKPFLALEEYIANATHSRRILTNITLHTKDPSNYELAVKNLENSANEVLKTVENLKKESQMQDQASYSLSLESMTGLEEVLTQRMKIGELVGVLDEFARGERHMTAHRAMKEARRLVQEIRDVGVTNYLAGANDAFDRASLQSASIQERIYSVDDVLSRVSNLRGGLARWDTVRDAVGAAAEKVWEAGDLVGDGGGERGDRLAALRDRGRQIAIIYEQLKTLPPHNTTVELRGHLTTLAELGASIPALHSELKRLIEAAEEKEGILNNIVPMYKEKYLDEAERHAAKLKMKATEYKNLFSGARSASSQGVSAANAWADITAHVTQASALASRAQSTVAETAQLMETRDPLAEAEESVKKSKVIKDRGAKVVEKSNEVSKQLEQLRRSLERVDVSLRGVGWLERALAARPPTAAAAAAAPHALKDASAQADRVFAMSRALYDEAREASRLARYSLRRRLAALQRHGDSALGAAQEHVSQTRGNTIRAQELIASLSQAASSRAAEHAAADSHLSPKFAELRAAAARARHAADSISVSLTSSPVSPGCFRAYRVSPTPSPITRISLFLSFENAVSDGPILHLEGEDAFLNLTVESGRVKVAWDLGEGVSVVHAEEEIEANIEGADRSALYRMEIERIWNTVRLTVERSGRTGVVSSHTGPGEQVTFTPRRLWLGSPAGGVGGRGLPACVHAMSYNDRRVGLWNFLEQPNEAQCQGCLQRASSLRSDGLCHMSGAGYAEVRRSGLRPTDRRRLSLSFTFRTRDEDALLFMAKEPHSNRSVSVYLRGCRVVLAVQYSGARLELVARGRHCHGRAVRVHAVRLLAPASTERGSLRVNGEETLGSPEPSIQDEAALPDLSGASYWVGGVPPGMGGAGGGAGGGAQLPPPLLGCVGALVVDREGLDLMDTSRRSGVEAGCGNRPIHSVTISPTGYLELPSRSLGRKSAIGISFLTRAATRQIAELRPDNDHHLLLKLDEGELELSIRAGKSEVTLRSNGTTYNDGLMHTVRIVRLHKEVELWVDEHRVSTSPLGGNAIPAGDIVFGEGKTSGDEGEMGSEGTDGGNLLLAEFIIDGTALGFESAGNMSGCVLGRAPPAPRPAAPRTLRDNPPLCAKSLCLLRSARTVKDNIVMKPAQHNGDELTPWVGLNTLASSYSVEPDAVKFGDRNDSYATFRLEPRTKVLNVALQFRTFRSTGMLMLNTGSKLKPKHYVLLSLKDGKLKLTVRARKKKEVTLPTPYNDGNWKSVSIRVSNKKIVLSSGGAAATGRAPRRLAFGPRLYVGGAPKQAWSPGTSPGVGGVWGVVGCVRRVRVSGRARDVARAAAHVAQCFPAVTPAAHFAGDAYAVWSKSWAAAAEVRLRFKTHEPNGVLLANNAFILEIVDGTISLTTFSREGGESKAVWAGGALCDGGWHRARAALWPLPAVDVDLPPPPSPLGGHHDSRTQATGDGTVTSPLFIAGVPENYEGVGSGKENFKGCIEDIDIGGEMKDWTAMDALHNVLIDSCPAS